MSGDYDDLLCGLGSDDLNDFDLEEGVPHEDDLACADEHDDDFDKTLAEDPFLASIISQPPAFDGFTGFSTGAGKGLPPPSAAALARGRHILEEALSLSESVVDDICTLPIGIPSFAPPALLAPRASGFTTAAGRPVPPASAAALAKAAALLNDDLDDPATPQGRKRQKTSHDFAQVADMPSRVPTGTFPDFEMSHLDAAQAQALERFSDPLDELDDVDYPQGHTLPARPDLDTVRFGSGFTTAKGVPLAPPSRSALAAVSNLFGDMDETPSTPAPLFTSAAGKYLPPADTSSRDTVAQLFGDLDGPSTSTSFSFASGSPAPMNPSSRDRAFEVFGESPGPPRAHPDFASSHAGPPPASNAFSTPSRPLLRPSSQSFRSPMLIHRTPLQQHTNTFSIPKGKPIMIKSELRTPTLKRLGVGARPTSIKRGRTSFSTPFTDGGAKARMATQGSQVTPVRAPMPKAAARDEVVFDMTVSSGRQTMREAYLKPGYYTREELEEMGLPGDLWELDLSNACEYFFNDVHFGDGLGPAIALATLQADGCRLVTRRWVDNHYAQILWKLAGLCRAQQSLFSTRWNWSEVIDQLKYRYERETGRAERPIVRRIQEHDSSGAVPMVLVVSAVRWVAMDAALGTAGTAGQGGQAGYGSQHGLVGNKGSQDTRQAGGMKPFLELTDGWYRIHAEIDGCLTKAVDKGRITPGQKLAICGAKLDSAGDGEEVLNALTKSRLIISGNSTSLARWDARLGLHPPFVAGLSSLSPDGGVVNMIDVVLAKVFDIAWLNTDKSVHEDPWNEAEEAIRRDRWQEKYLSEIARLNEEMQAGLDPLRSLAESLASSAESVEPDAASPPDDIDDQFERLLGEKDQNRMLGRLSDAMVYHMAIYAGQRLQREMARGALNVQSELDSIHPPRDVRHFRMVRVRDAIDGNRPAFRNAMLTVWDAKGLDMKEGERYRITSLYPGRQGDWSLPKSNEGEAGAIKEIYLGTRRETRWMAVA